MTKKCAHEIGPWLAGQQWPLCLKCEIEQLRDQLRVACIQRDNAADEIERLTKERDDFSREVAADRRQIADMIRRRDKLIGIGGEIERLQRALRNCADYANYPQDGADIGRKVRLNGVADVCAVALRGSSEPCEQRCPHDGGKCHHGCADECFRATGGGSLSNPWPGFPVACTHPIKGAMPDIGEAIAMKADEGRQCTCAKDNHGVDCAWNGCCGQCSGMRTGE